MGFDPRQRRADEGGEKPSLADILNIDETPQARNRAIIPPDVAGDTVTSLVKANIKVVLGTKRLGMDRIRDSRNALSESAFTHFELVSMLAVALDRLAVFEALTPTPSIERVTDILRREIRGCTGITPHHDQLDKIARAVLDR